MITRRRKLYRLTRRMPRPTNFPFCAHCVANFLKSLAATWAGHDPQGMKTVVPKVPFQRDIVGVMEPSMDKKPNQSHLHTHGRPLVARICHTSTNTTIAVASAITVSIVPIPTIAVTSSMPSASLRDMKANITNVLNFIFSGMWSMIPFRPPQARQPRAAQLPASGPPDPAMSELAW